MCTDTQEQADELLTKYKNLDLDFAIDQKTLQELIGITDDAVGKEIVDLLGNGNGM